MISVCLYAYLSLFIHLAADGLKISVPPDLTLDSNAFSFDIEMGDSVHNTIESFCTHNGGFSFDREGCMVYADIISFHLYGIAYTPSRNSSNVEDFYTTRTSLIQYFTKKYNVKNYLEIGCGTNQSFTDIASATHDSSDGHAFNVAWCVDPFQGGTHRTTSDDFFFQNNVTFELIFIDGLHEARQAQRDITNALRWLTLNGTIILHDCNPRRYEHQVYPQPDNLYAWNGDTWRTVVALRLQDGLEIVVGDFDHGVGVVRRRLNKYRLPVEWEQKLLSSDPLSVLDWTDFDTHRNTFLRLMSLQELKLWMDEV